MIIKRLNFIYNVDKINDDLYSYASLPIVTHLKNDVFRIYFSPRDKINRSCGTYLDYDIFLNKILYVNETPILKPGKPGFFDDAGAQPCALVTRKNEDFLYYTGWSLNKSIPFKTFLGLAKKKFNEDFFQKYSLAPILDRTKQEPLSVGWCYVLFEDNKFKMWYESNVDWKLKNNDWEHYFNIKFAESNDGINWKRKGKVCIEISQDETVVSRPSIIKENNLYKMWYCYKVEKLYRIGYAESYDGENWTRKDNLIKIIGDSQKWDEHEMSYPNVIIHKGIKFLFYNGNHYGLTGFGVAIIED